MRRICLVVLLFAALSGLARSQSADPSPTESGFFVPQPGIVRPHLLHAVPAAYPNDAQLAQKKHVCVVSAIVSPTGSVSSTKVLNSQPSPFDELAIKAVKESTFSPGMRNHDPVAVEVELYLNFRGDGNPALPAMERGLSIQPPRPTYDPNAEYSEKARRARISGQLSLSFLVMEDGRTADIQVIQKLGSGLDEEAVKAVSRWRFDPATIDGDPVPVRITTEMNFRLR